SSPPRSSPLYSYSHPPALPLHSFPTRRSSYLEAGQDEARAQEASPAAYAERRRDRKRVEPQRNDERDQLPAQCAESSATSGAVRSEEHTSELQSHLNLVRRLVLEKKQRRQIDE